jgi:hypothetical protein
MKVFALWHGGNSYSEPYVADDTEEFESISEAKEECARRFNNHDGSTPAVDESSGMTLYFADPRDESDPIPDRLIVMGKRGGWRVQS